MEIEKSIAVVGGGPSGLTVALLLAKLGYNIKLFEQAKEIGGLWSSELDANGFLESENSCKVYQSSYLTCPALFKLIGTKWEDHFVPRHDLKKDWFRPFMANSSASDLRKLFVAFLLNISGLKSYRKESVYDFLDKLQFSEPFQKWMRATALGGITGTMQMTVWELFHRFGYNISSLFFKKSDPLYWNAQPPNSNKGFVSKWRDELLRLNVQIFTDYKVNEISMSGQTSRHQFIVNASKGSRHVCDAVFLSVPPPALSGLFSKSHPSIIKGWGHHADQLTEILEASVYEHIGISWLFDQVFQKDLPLGGYNVRKSWHPILVQYSQYSNYLRPPGKTIVIGSLSLKTHFKHHRLGTLPDDHSPEELARIIWEDEQLMDPRLPDPTAVKIYGNSSATQIVKYGPLPVKHTHLPIYLSTSINGKSPYFTASLESAIQAGNAAALAFDSRVLRLPT